MPLIRPIQIPETHNKLYCTESVLPMSSETYNVLRTRKACRRNRGTVSTSLAELGLRSVDISREPRANQKLGALSPESPRVSLSLRALRHPFRHESQGPDTLMHKSGVSVLNCVEMVMSSLPSYLIALSRTTPVARGIRIRAFVDSSVRGFSPLPT